MYQWLVFVHLLGLVLFLLGHGVSIGCSFRARRERERAVITALLDLSSKGNQAGMVGLVVMAVAGLAAAWNTNQLTAPWIVASYVVLVAVILGMGAVASSYYYPLRDAINGAKGASPIRDEELIQRLDNRRPEVLALIGGVGLVLLVWLMVLKPG
jgi:uncharacterized membrane protein YhhN